MEELTHGECGQCGWLGLLTDTEEHPDRPTPMDFGFCPDCLKDGRVCEIDNHLTASEAEALLSEYDK